MLEQERLEPYTLALYYIILYYIVLYIYMRNRQHSLFLFNQNMDVIGVELDLSVLQCFGFARTYGYIQRWGYYRF